MSGIFTPPQQWHHTDDICRVGLNSILFNIYITHNIVQYNH